VDDMQSLCLTRLCGTTENSQRCSEYTSRISAGPSGSRRWRLARR
jgi:hypothetical protein